MDLQKESDLFEQWWEDEGQYHRAGGDDYCKTFACEAWIFSKAQSEKALLEQFEINNKLVEQIEKLKAQAVPEGFVVVPKQPTPKMIDATWNFDEEIQDMSHNSRNEFIYNAMIAAAQEQAND